MATDTVVLPNIIIQGNLTYAGTITPAIARTALALDSLQSIPIEAHEWRVWDAPQTVLPNPSAADDLGMYLGTFATAGNYIATSDLKTLGATTRYARVMKHLPFEYSATESVQVRMSAGMKTAVADASCTLDVDAYLVGRDGTLGSNLYAGAAVTMNSLTASEKTFSLTASTLLPGSVLDIRIAVTCTDAGGASAVIAAIYHSELLVSLRG